MEQRYHLAQLQATALNPLEYQQQRTCTLLNKATNSAFPNAACTTGNDCYFPFNSSTHSNPHLSKSLADTTAQNTLMHFYRWIISTKQV